MAQSLAHIALVVRDYDEAIAWFTGKLGFTLVADEYQPEQDKRWVLVAPPGPAAARCCSPAPPRRSRRRFIGNQAGGRVFLFLATDDFGRDYAAMTAKGVRFVREPAGALRQGRRVRGSLRQSVGPGGVRQVIAESCRNPSA